MAPARPREPSIDRSTEYEEFMTTLEAYHEKRGTTLEREPKVGSRHLDLLRLYKRVCEEGGYDRASDTRGNKLAWRRIAAEFLPGSSNVTTQAFVVKTTYYKNLAAYEISDFHKKEPPPKEILEDVSAKGGDLLTRTLENFHRPESREAEMLANGQDSEMSEADEQTPKEEKMDIDEPGSTGGRVTRALRHAPPQRVLFQPDGGRQTRNSTNMASPSPAGQSGGAQTNGLYSSNGAAATIANYEPRQPVPSAVKPVVTPSNNPEYFRSLALRNRPAASSKVTQSKGMMLPGTGFIGPNIYVRALLALQSGLIEEQAYALHHLVKISHERGDKYRFDGFPGLAEALMAKILEISSLFYNVKWDVTYTGEEDTSVESLDGLCGTSNLLERLQNLERLNVADDVQDADFMNVLGRINEAGLVLRNMVMMDENAEYVSQIPLVRDLITILLNLPNHSLVVELQHYAREIAEQVTRYWSLDSKDPVYISLLSQLDSPDRGTIITSLRALSRISLQLEVKNRLANVPPKLIQQVSDWLLVEDEELRNACLDFLYQFTAVLENVELLVHSIDIESLVKQLSRLLMHNAVVNEPKIGKSRAQSSQVASSAPKLSTAMIEQLAALDEPERSSQWLKTCFEEDSAGEITQIELWRAYNEAFTQALSRQESSKGLMQAKEFITNVSSTFQGAQAQVVTTGNTQKYTIRGIRPRATPISPQSHRPYIRCQWHSKNNDASAPRSGAASPPAFECGEYTSQAKQMWEHIIATHLNLSRDDATGKWLLESKPNVNGGGTPVETHYNCHWADCKHFAATNGDTSAFVVGMHIKTHLPDDSLKAPIRHRYNRAEPPPDYRASFSSIGTIPYNQRPPPTKWVETALDDKQDPTGLPFASLLVLRNLARQMGKLDYSGQGTTTTRKRHRDEYEDEDPLLAGQRGGWVRKAFDPVKDQLFYIVANNWGLREQAGGLASAMTTSLGLQMPPQI